MTRLSSSNFKLPKTASSGLRFACFVAMVSLFVSAASAGTVSGTVRNGTDGKPAAGVQVILIQLQGGMQPVAKTKTDASGRYEFDYPMLGQQPMLIRAVYHGVFYHQPVPPGTSTADVEVFDATNAPTSITLGVRAIFIQPSTSSISIGEEYSLENKTQPPVAFYRDDGSFRFALPEGAQLHDISAQGPAGMPVIQSAIDKGHNESAIAFAFRPGETGVRVSYDVPYNGSHGTVKFNSPYAVGRMALLAQPSVQVSADGFSPAGTDQGFNVYLRDNIPANSPVSVSISGVAPPQQASAGDQGSQPSGNPADNSQNPSVNSRLDQSGAEAPTATTTTLPARLDSLKWVLVLGFAAIFALGFFYLWRRPQFAAAGAEDSPVAATVAPVAAPLARESKPVATKPAAVTSSEGVERAVEMSLDQLKDSLFRLELRHQAGTISDGDYTRERERIETHLRGLLRG